MRDTAKLIALAAVAAACIALVGCDGDRSGASVSKDIDDVTVTYSVDGKNTTLTWEPVDGVKFSVYRADSRYGQSKLLVEGITDGSYTDGFRGGYYRIIARDKSGKKLRTFETVSEERDLLGDNVYVFSPDDSYAVVDSVLGNINGKQFGSEFTSDRYAVMFRAGEYNNRLTVRPGYYTTYSGLGVSPDDVKIQSLYNPNLGAPVSNALINFWRGVENMTFKANGTWAVSQGAFLRRVNVLGDLRLHDGGGFASGGFISDSNITGTVESGSQQQWLMHDSTIGGWSGNVWNMCFTGTVGAPTGDYPEYKYTVRDETPVSRSKPYLIFTDEGYELAVPDACENVRGAGDRETTVIGGDKLYFARADRDDADTVNAALASGKNVVFTPGIYSLDKPIKVENDGAVILGMGLATLEADNADACMIVTGDDVTVAGILFDAGAHSRSLMRVEGDGEKAYLHDVFFRVGGASREARSVDTALDISKDGTYLDNVWIWRADHGCDNSYGIGWNKNIGLTGLKVTADDVIADGLFVEHFERNNVLWTGNFGKVFFFQSEIAYDVPDNESWKNGERRGYPSFEVGDGVTAFEGRGMGVYSHFLEESITLDCAVRIPDAAGVKIEHLCAVAISGGVMANIVNDFGGEVKSGDNMKFVTEYSNNSGV